MRSREQVKAGIMTFCSHRSRTVSQVMLSQNLSHRALTLQLDDLVHANMVEIEMSGRRRLIHTTNIGNLALSCYRNAFALMNGMQSKCPLRTDVSREHQDVSVEVA